MIVYATEHGKYFSVAESLKKDSETPRGIYINLTNLCNNDCVFCLREKKNMAEESSLWLKKIPTVEEIQTEILKVPEKIIKEFVFCGFGEPTMRLEELLQLLKFLKKKFPTVPTRLNTNGLAELEYDGENVAEKFAGILDVASISLNSATAEKYLKITRSKFGLKSYAAMLDFAEHMKNFVPQVVMTIVDKVTPPEEIEECKKICAERNLTLRVRPYEDS